VLSRELKGFDPQVLLWVEVGAFLLVLTRVGLEGLKKLCPKRRHCHSDQDKRFQSAAGTGLAQG